MEQTTAPVEAEVMTETNSSNGLSLLTWLGRMVVGLATVLVLTAATIGAVLLASHLLLANGNDANDDSMIGLWYLVVIVWGGPAAYAVWSLIVAAKSPAGWAGPTLVGVVLPVIVVAGLWKLESVGDQNRAEEAEVVARSFLDEMPATDGITSGGGSGSSSYICQSTSNAWSISNDVSHEHAYEWIVAAERELTSRGWDVATRHEIEDHPAPRPDEESIVVVGVSGQESISFKVRLFANGSEASGYRANARTTTNAYVGECITELSPADIGHDPTPLAPVPAVMPDIFD